MLRVRDLYPNPPGLSGSIFDANTEYSKRVGIFKAVVFSKSIGLISIKDTILLPVIHVIHGASSEKYVFTTLVEAPIKKFLPELSFFPEIRNSTFIVEMAYITGFK